MKNRMRVGEKGQVVIPKEVRERAGIREGTEVSVNFRDGEVVVRRVGPPVGSYVEFFANSTSKKLAGEIDLKRLIEAEYDERTKHLR